MSSDHLRPLWFGFNGIEILWQLDNPDGTMGLWQDLHHDPSIAGTEDDEHTYFYLWNWYVIPA